MHRQLEERHGVFFIPQFKPADIDLVHVVGLAGSNNWHHRGKQPPIHPFMPLFIAPDFTYMLFCVHHLCYVWRCAAGEHGKVSAQLRGGPSSQSLPLLHKSPMGKEILSPRCSGQSGVLTVNFQSFQTAYINSAWRFLLLSTLYH